MKTIQVSNGDIVLDNGGRLQFNQGNNKLLQDLALWLKEPLGVGFTTPNFGSLLNGMVGSSSASGILTQIQTEITRILNLYRNQQLLVLQTAQSSSQLSNWNKSEIISSIDSVQVSLNQTTIIVYVSITSLSGSVVTLNLSISPNGVLVNNG